MVQTIKCIIFLEMKILFYFLYLITLAVSMEIQTTAKFVKDYFQEKGIFQIASFGCLNNDGSSYYTNNNT